MNPFKDSENQDLKSAWAKLEEASEAFNQVAPSGKRIIVDVKDLLDAIRKCASVEVV
jgi:hypothetical protein